MKKALSISLIVLLAILIAFNSITLIFEFANTIHYFSKNGSAFFLNLIYTLENVVVIAISIIGIILLLKQNFSNCTKLTYEQKQEQAKQKKLEKLNNEIEKLKGE